MQVSPTGNTVYTLTATNSAGTVTATATVTVTGPGLPQVIPMLPPLTPNIPIGPLLSLPPIINKFTIDRKVIIVGETAKLEWNVSGATDISLRETQVFNFGVGSNTWLGLSATGSMSVSPSPANSYGYDYILSATNSNGTVYDTLILMVNP